MRSVGSCARREIPPSRKARGSVRRVHGRLCSESDGFAGAGSRGGNLPPPEPETRTRDHSWMVAAENWPFRAFRPMAPRTISGCDLALRRGLRSHVREHSRPIDPHHSVAGPSRRAPHSDASQVARSLSVAGNRRAESAIALVRLARRARPRGSLHFEVPGLRRLSPHTQLRFAQITPTAQREGVQALSGEARLWSVGRTPR